MCSASLILWGADSTHLLTCYRLLFMNRNKELAQIPYFYSITHLTLPVLCFTEFTHSQTETAILQPTNHTQQGTCPSFLHQHFFNEAIKDTFQSLFPRCWISIPEGWLAKFVLSLSLAQCEPPAKPHTWYTAVVFPSWGQYRCRDNGNWWFPTIPLPLDPSANVMDAGGKRKREMHKKVLVTRAPMPH